MPVVIGWDIGGVNTKATALTIADGAIADEIHRSTYFEVWRDRTALADVLRSLAASLPPADVWAATMTAELSDAFATKREGVGFVVDALVDAASVTPVAVFAVDGTFLPPNTARAAPLRVAAANWAATARVVAELYPHAILVDVGSTTADVIPIADGRVVARGLTDPERLLSGELVYTGAVRTPISAIVQAVPLWGGWCRVSSEYFAIAADVHLLLGNISPAEYLGETPDRRGKTATDAAARLARVVCADTEMLGAAEIQAIAGYVADRQVDQIATAIRQVCSTAFRDAATPPIAVTAGLGAFLARAAAARAGLKTVDLAATLGPAGSIVAPSAAVARLWAREAGWRAA